MTERDGNGPGPGWPGRWWKVRGTRARLIQGLLILGVMGVLLLALDGLSRTTAPGPGPAPAGVPAGESPGAPVAGGRTGTGPSGPGQITGDGGGLAQHEARLARELEALLSAVAGAGRVQATVRLASGPARVVAVDTRQTSRHMTERDTAGGVRTTEDGEQQSTPVLLRSDGGDLPLTLREEAPRIASVVVVARGAANSRVREQLYQTAAAALGVPVSRIMVVPMGGTDR